MAFCWLKIPSFLWFTPWLSILNSTSGTPTTPTIGFPAVIPTTGLQQFSGRRMWQPQAEYYFGCMLFFWTILRTLGSGTIQVVVGQLWSMATFDHFDTIFVHSDGLIQSNQSNQVGRLFTSNMTTLWSVYATLKNGSPFDMHSIMD